MALYDTPRGLYFKAHYREQGIKTFSAEFIRGKPYRVSSLKLYWIDGDSLYERICDFSEKIFTNPDLAETREFLVASSEVITITTNFTIRVYDLLTNTSQEIGPPNPRLQLMEIYGRGRREIQPDNIYRYNDHLRNLLGYSGQDFILLGLSFDRPKKWTPDNPKYHPINDAIAAKYNPETMLELNSHYWTYFKNGKLMIQSFESLYGIYEIPDDAWLYDPRPGPKSARSC